MIDVLAMTCVGYLQSSLISRQPFDDRTVSHASYVIVAVPGFRGVALWQLQTPVASRLNANIQDNHKQHSYSIALRSEGQRAPLSDSTYCTQQSSLGQEDCDPLGSGREQRTATFAQHVHSLRLTTSAMPGQMKP